MTNYPNKFDDDSSIPAVVDGITEVSGDTINAVRSAVIALEQTVGLNPQGSATTLVERLNVITNTDGTFKSSALNAAGLIALPITNAQVGGSAGILESKLDLDVPTQTLQDEISSVNTAIAALQASSNVIVNNLGQHIAGTFGRHDGYDVNLAGGLVGAPTINTVGLAANFIYNNFLAHRATPVVGEHFASAISYVPNDDGAVQENNVQDAISSIDTAFVEALRKSNSASRSNGISKDGYVDQGGQASVNDASLRLSRYQTFSGTDAVKVGLINAASVKSRGFSPIAFSANAQSITFVVKSGSSTRTLAITGLHTAQYPTSNSRFFLKAVVDYLNASFANASNHFPLQAYESSDGELVIQHNVARPDCTITIQSPTSFSAIGAIGFTDVVDVEIGPASSYIFDIDGTSFSELRTISTNSLTQASSSSIVDLGIDVGSVGLALNRSALFHVFNHSNQLANGTYLVATVSSSPGTLINLNTTLAAGTFDYIVYDDSIFIGSPSAPQTLDFYIDNTRKTLTQIRAVINSIGISGVAVVEVSPTFGAGTGILTLALSSGVYSLTITFNGQNGLSASFNAGFIGYLRVYAPNNLDYITVLVSNPSPTAPASSSLTFFASAPQNTLLFLGTSSFDAAATVEIPLDRRNVGLVGKTAIGTELEDGLVNNHLRNLYANGIVRGLLTTATSTTISVQGGSLYVNGKLINREGTTLSALNVAASDGTWNLVISEDNNFEIFNNSTAGYDFQSILANTRFTSIAQFVVSGSVITSITDARYFLNNVPSKLSLVVDDRELGAGTFRSLNAALLYSANAPSNAKFNISSISDLTVSQDITVLSNREFDAFGDMTIASNITIDDNGAFRCHGSLVMTGNISVGTGATLGLFGAASITGTITLNSGATLEVNGSLSVSQIIVSGDGAVVRGTGYSTSVINFDGTQTSGGLVISGTNGGTLVSRVSLQTPNTAMSGIVLNNGAHGTHIDNCYIAQNYTINETNWSSTARVGLVNKSTSVLNNIKITNCIFYNWADAISGEDSTGTTTSFENLLVDDCQITNCGRGLYFESIADSQISNNVFSTLKFAGLKMLGTGSISGTIITDNIFQVESTTSGTLIMVDLGSSVITNTTISNNSFSDFSGVAAIQSTNTTVSGFTFCNNLISGTKTSSNYLINFKSITSGQLAVSGNLITSHIGNPFALSNGEFSNNDISSVVNSSTVESAYLVGTILATGNKISLTSNREFAMAPSLFDSNIVSAPSITSGSTGSSIISNNLLTCTDLSATSSFDITLSLTGGFNKWENNVLQPVATTNGLNLSGTGNFILNNNIFKATSSSNIIQLVSGSGTTEITNNYINGISGVSVMINNARSNVAILNNLFASSDSGAPLSSTILCSSGTSNLYIEGNFLNAGGVGGSLISHLNATPVAVRIGVNKGATSALTYSSLAVAGDLFTGWTFEDGTSQQFIQSDTTSSVLVVPLTGLPVGALLLSVSFSSSTAALATINGTIYRRPSTSVAAAALSSAVSNSGTGTTTTTITPSSTHYIINKSEYFLILRTTALSVGVGTIVATIQY